ncbi:MAG: hypothetical protein D6706_16295 [Chloroflexi bacterium]|nr:MAG: hypothetical protein D6706_16295 [Chloroflexota bacterium]
MAQKKDLPFSQVLDLLFGEEKLPIHLLYRLSDMTPEEFGEFKSRWPHVTDERRRVLVRHMADLSENNFVVDFSPVFGYCLVDPQPAVRLAALDGVWDSTNVLLIEPIIQLLKHDADLEVRAASAAALAHYVLMAEWGELPGRVSGPIVEALLEVYESRETAVSIRRAALEALGAATHPRIATLIEDAYEGDDPDLQLSAIFAMGNTADSRWLPILLDEMLNSSAEIRQEAARAAGAIGHKDAVPHLIDLLADENEDVVLAAIGALAEIGGEEAYNALSSMADDEAYEAFHEVLEEALESMDWLADFDWLSLSEVDFEDPFDLE